MVVFSEKLRAKLAVLPDESGIYKMFDIEGNILYVGKAKNLKSRVRSYFVGQQERELTRQLVTKVHDLEIIITYNEKEALLLENTLIKKYQPPFNISLKDDKTYPYLKLIKNPYEAQIFKTREPYKDKNPVFGPYTKVKKLEEYLYLLNDIYPLKKCFIRRFPQNQKPCLYFHMGKCQPYCTKEIDVEKTKGFVKEVEEILSGNSQDIIQILKEKMALCSKNKEYEMALKFRNHLHVLEAKMERQFVSFKEGTNFDVFHVHFSEHHLTFVVLNFREGKLENKFTSHHENKAIDKSEKPSKESESFFNYFSELFSHFIRNFYEENADLISEVILPFELEELDLLKDFIEGKIRARLEEDVAKKFHLEISIPQAGKKRRFLELARMNASLSFQELLRKKEKEDYSRALKELLKLPKKPRVIESFDIANTADSAIMAGMVRYVDGKKDKAGYRIFHMKETVSQNDFASMEEAVYRRYNSLLKEKKPFPDLILIDGGRQQLQSAVKSLRSLGISGQPIISLAKREEEIYVPKQVEPFKLSFTDPALAFLISVRDETHRFVNTSHIRKRDSLSLKSLLMEIEGIGEKKKNELLQSFDSLESILESSEERLLSLPNFTQKDVKAIKIYLEKYLNSTRMSEN